MTWRPGTVVGPGAAALESPTVVAVSADQSSCPSWASRASVRAPRRSPTCSMNSAGRKSRSSWSPAPPPVRGRLAVLITVTTSRQPSRCSARSRAAGWPGDLRHQSRGGRGHRCRPYLTPGVTATIARTIGRISPHSHLLVAAPSSTSWLMPADAAATSFERCAPISIYGRRTSITPRTCRATDWSRQCDAVSASARRTAARHRRSSRAAVMTRCGCAARPGAARRAGAAV